MDPFQIVKTNWSPGDTREIEDWRIDRQEGIEYDSYRRVYIADGKEWMVAGQVMKPSGKKFYILECVE